MLSGMARHQRITHVLRESMGWPAPRGSQQEMAENLGVSAATVSRWLTGVSSPAPESWSSIEAYLELPEGTLAERELGPDFVAVDADGSALVTELKVNQRDDVGALVRRVESLQRDLEEQGRTIAAMERQHAEVLASLGDAVEGLVARVEQVEHRDVG